MTDAWGEPEQGKGGGGNAHEYTVSEISGALKRSVEDMFGHVRVRAELSGVKRAASGHVYFGLKDDKAVMDGVCWRGVASGLSFVPEDGLEVVCTGRLTTYPARSKYQMVVERMEPAGAGALMALLEERKKKLKTEGLFDPRRKKPIPYLPKVIGIVTSPTGAVIRDILHRLSDRFPRRVIVWPVLVQGQGAAEQVAAAIKGFNALGYGAAIPRPDVLIVARGGGSIEDLWSFNEEIVVRAAADSDIPLISAVGHETDTTLIDYASDLRAPTPTAAAEKAVPVRSELQATVLDYARRLSVLQGRLVGDRRERLVALERALPKPRDILGLVSQRFDELSDRLPRSLQAIVQAKAGALNRLIGGLGTGQLRRSLGFSRNRFDAQAVRLQPAYSRRLTQLSDRLEARARMLDSLSYERVLDRGFALVSDREGKAVTHGAALTEGESVTVRFADTARAMTVGGATPQSQQPTGGTPPRRGRKPKKQTPGKTDDRQGSLL